MSNLKSAIGDHTISTLVERFCGCVEEFDGAPRSNVPASVGMRLVFQHIEAFEREADIYATDLERRNVAEIAEQITLFATAREFRNASAVATSYGMAMGQSTNNLVRSFALRAAKMAPSVAPGAMNAENAVAFCSMLEELETALEHSLAKKREAT